jgi:hypothetical protein
VRFPFLSFSSLLELTRQFRRYLRQLNLDSDLVTAKNFNIYDPLSRSSGTLALDGQTLAHIEVLQNSLGGTEGTLLQLLSRCVTPFGKRLFKVWLCAPLRDVKGINDRFVLLPLFLPFLLRLALPSCNSADNVTYSPLQSRRRRRPHLQLELRRHFRLDGQKASRPRTHAFPHSRQDLQKGRLRQGRRRV